MRFLVLASLLLIADDALGAECLAVGSFIQCSDGTFGQRIGDRIFMPDPPKPQADPWGGAVVQPRSNEDRRAIDAIIAPRR